MNLLDWLLRRPSQLDRIELQLLHMEGLMSTQEQDLNDALAAYFQAVSDGLDRIEAKTPNNVDLSDEIQSIKDAQATLEARVPLETPPAGEPPAGEPPAA